MKFSIESDKQVTNTCVIGIADSLCPPFVGDQTFKTLQKNVDQMVTASEEKIKTMMTLLFNHYGLMIEGAGVTTLAGLMENWTSDFEGNRVVAVVSGSNSDFETYTKFIQLN